MSQPLLSVRELVKHYHPRGFLARSAPPVRAARRAA